MFGKEAHAERSEEETVSDDNTLSTPHGPSRSSEEDASSVNPMLRLLSMHASAVAFLLRPKATDDRANRAGDCKVNPVVLEEFMPALTMPAHGLRAIT
jgi:hypothetical protein